MSLLDNAFDAPVSSVLMVLLIFMYLGGLIGGSGFANKVSLVVSDTLGTNMYIWNVFTAGLFEKNVLKLALDLACVSVAGRRVEAAMGIESFAVMAALVNLACGVLCSTALFALYVLTRYEVYLFTPSYGFGGMVGCLCVALKWLAPHEPVLPSHPGLGLQNSHLPLLFVLSSSLAWALGLDGFATDTCFVVMGTYVGWWYLRFVHRSPTASSAVAAGSSSSSGSNTGFGDNSDEFALMTLFPPGLRKYLSPIADFSYGVCVLLGFFKDRKAPPKSPSDDASLDPHAAMLLGLPPHASSGGFSSSSSSSASGQPEVEAYDPVAERRRQKARAQLDAKLAAMESAANGDEEWDDDEIVASSSPSKDKSGNSASD